MATKATPVPCLLKKAIDKLNVQRIDVGLAPVDHYPLTYADAQTLLAQQAEAGLEVSELRRLVGEHADAVVLAAKLRDRYLDLVRVWDERDREFIHKQFTTGAIAEEYDDNTGGGIWNSNATFKTSSGRTLVVCGNSDSVSIYLSPKSAITEAREWLWELAGEDNGYRLAEGYYEAGGDEVSELDAIYARFCDNNKLPQVDPEEILEAMSLSGLQCNWLRTYINTRGKFDRKRPR